MKAYANEFRKKRILKNKKLKREKKYMATNKFSERERKMVTYTKITRKKQVYQPCRFSAATTFTGIPLPLTPPQNQGDLDLMYINSQASFPKTAQDFDLD